MTREETLEGIIEIACSNDRKLLVLMDDYSNFIFRIMDNDPKVLERVVISGAQASEMIKRIQRRLP